ncbi:MAG: hypothetical protein JXR77_07995 [Lentisphaeria bacterium]|nr:hypothetical protein [Lentisphaeria bacterium]
MATSIFRNKNLVRPHKKGKARRQRVKVQRKRLVGLGMPETAVEALNVAQIRALLRRPAEVAGRYQTAE